jgi:hypothetical protein
MAMARHKVELDVGKFDVGNVDVVFRVRRDGRMFGRLKVSQGAVEWMPRGKKKYAREMGWATLDEIFRRHGHKTPTRSY